MPGSDICGRCGTSLRLATAVIDVHPPRAGGFRKRVRKAAPIRRAAIGVRDALASADTRSPILRIVRQTPWRLFLRLVVPGWSHFYAGQRVRGHLFLWGTLACLLPGLLLLGTLTGSLLIGLAFSVHSWAALDIVTQTFPDTGMRGRMLRSLTVSVILAVLLYLPAGRLLGRVIEPTVITYTVPPFREGDVLLRNNLSAPQPGQVVLYTIPELRIEQSANGHTRHFVQFAGERVDRILAGPGDRVVWSNGRLTVNGKPSPLQPLNPAVTPASLSLTVPADTFFILPTTSPYLYASEAESTWRALSLVPAHQLMGRVYARTSPLSRITLFRLPSGGVSK